MSRSRFGRRVLLAAGSGLLGAAGLGLFFRRRVIQTLARFSKLPEFYETPKLVQHDPATERRTIYVARDAGPAANVDAVLDRMGGVERLVGVDDVVIIKVSAQWWNQGMTNVAAVKRVIERIIGRDRFAGEVIVFENVHFRLQNGSGLSRGWTRPSDRNVDVPGWNKLADLIPHFERLSAPVSFVGLVDAGRNELAHDHWHDPQHEHGIYGGDGRGPIGPNEDRDGYVWDFERTFRKKRSYVDYAQTPLTWPVFSSPRTGVVVDFKDGLFKRENGRRTKIDRKLVFVNMPTLVAHGSTGMSSCCKSPMGIVDMSAGRMGSDPRVADYQSVHHFGSPGAMWRMAGPLAHFAKHVRQADLYIVTAEWVAAAPKGWDEEANDARLAVEGAHHAGLVIAGTDPVAIDTWASHNVLMRLKNADTREFDLGDPDSKLSRFLRYYREVYGKGTMAPELISVA